MAQTATRIRYVTIEAPEIEQQELFDKLEGARLRTHELKHSGAIHPGDYTIDHAVDVIAMQLPPVFYDDHVSRELPAGVELHRTQKSVRVLLDRDTYDELLSDARFYADPSMGYAAEGYAGLVSSARATVKRLEAVEPPMRHPCWPVALGKHVVEIEEGETIWNPTRSGHVLHGPARFEVRIGEDRGLDIRELAS